MSVGLKYKSVCEAMTEAFALIDVRARSRLPPNPGVAPTSLSCQVRTSTEDCWHPVSCSRQMAFRCAKRLLRMRLFSRLDCSINAPTRNERKLVSMTASARFGALRQPNRIPAERIRAPNSAAKWDSSAAGSDIHVFSVSRFWLIRANSSPSVLVTVVEIGHEPESGRVPPLAVPRYG
jgi:hypothetical protein